MVWDAAALRALTLESFFDFQGLVSRIAFSKCANRQQFGRLATSKSSEHPSSLLFAQEK